MARVYGSYEFKNGNGTTKHAFNFDEVSPEVTKRNYFYDRQHQDVVNHVKNDLSISTFIFISIPVVAFIYVFYNYITNEETGIGVSLPLVYAKLLWSLLFGIGTSIFCWMITYLDSDQPGINPPTPLSPRRPNDRYNTTTVNYFHFNYILCVFTGIVVTILTFVA